MCFVFVELEIRWRSSKHAFHMTKCIADPLVKLRSRWFKRLSDTRHCLKITAALISGCREPPLSDVEDLLESLGCPPGDHLLHTPPGQPFRLHLWHRLAVFLGDPDADFLLSLEKGVPLGVNTDLIPSRRRCDRSNTPFGLH